MNFKKVRSSDERQKRTGFPVPLNLLGGIALILAALLFSPMASLFAQGTGTQIFLPVVTNQVVTNQSDTEQNIEIDVEGLEAYMASQQSSEDELSALGSDVGCVNPIYWYGYTYFSSIKKGDNGYNVYLAQYYLMNYHNRSLAPYGADRDFGNTTYNAIREVQQYWKNQGYTACGRAIGVDGSVGPQTWAILIYKRTPAQASGNGYIQPTLGSSNNLCAVVPSANLWGQPRAIQALEAAGRAFKNSGYGEIALNDISLKNGGPMPGHGSHQQGLNADIRLIRTNRNQCSSGLLWCHPDDHVWSSRWGKNVCRSGATRLNPAYDREGTRRLIETLKSTGNVKSILYNDPAFAGSDTIWYGGHDDHLHVTYN